MAAFLFFCKRKEKKKRSSALMDREFQYLHKMVLRVTLPHNCAASRPLPHCQLDVSNTVLTFIISRLNRGGTSKVVSAKQFTVIFTRFYCSIFGKKFTPSFKLSQKVNHVLKLPL